MEKIKYAVLYHRGCVDGIAAGWSAYKRLGVEAVYLPYQYGEELPELAYGKHLVLVDLSMKLDVLSALVKEGSIKSVLVIDHHKTAINDLSDLPACVAYSHWQARLKKGEQFFVYLDKEYSGSLLSHAFFNDKHMKHVSPLDDIPKIFRYINDYDLWKHELYESKAITAAIKNEFLTIEKFDSVVKGGNASFESVLKTGRTILKYDNKLMEGIVKSYVLEVPLDDTRVAALINSPHHMRDEVGELLGPKYAFVGCYTIRDGKTVFSLRSNVDSGIDVTAIAEAYGGGGHKNAGAFVVNNDALQRYALERYFVKYSFFKRLRLAFNLLFNK